MSRMFRVETYRKNAQDAILIDFNHEILKRIGSGYHSGSTHFNAPYLKLFWIIKLQSLHEALLLCTDFDEPPLIVSQLAQQKKISSSCYRYLCIYKNVLTDYDDQLSVNNEFFKEPFSKKIFFRIIFYVIHLFTIMIIAFTKMFYIYAYC